MKLHKDVILILLSIGISIILTYCGFHTNIDGIKDILNAYMTINIAFLGILFAAISINPEFSNIFDSDKNSIDLFARSAYIAILGILLSMITYMLSYTESSDLISKMIPILFLLSGTMTFTIILALTSKIEELIKK